jgi:hypothetical protein
VAHPRRHIGSCKRRPIDVNIYQPVFQGNELSANAWVAPPNRHRHMSPVKEPFWDAQEALFRRMARPE